MKEEIDSKLADLKNDVDNTYQVIFETARSYLYCESIMPAVYTVERFGEGSDVSPWEMALEDIHGLMIDRFIRRSVDIWDFGKVLPASSQCQAESICPAGHMVSRISYLGSLPQTPRPDIRSETQTARTIRKSVGSSLLPRIRKACEDT